MESNLQEKSSNINYYDINFPLPTIFVKRI